MQLRIESPSSIPPISNTAITTTKPFLRRWWLPLLIALNIFFLLSGQISATLLSRFYFDKGGNSKWLCTLIQIVDFPILLPLFFLPSSVTPTTTTTTTTVLIYVGIGILVTGDDMLYSYGVAFLPVSTFSLLCVTQLALFHHLLPSDNRSPPSVGQSLKRT